MLISIITVCYNSSQTIRNTFESLLDQTYKEIELIVIDGGSKDGTVDLIKDYAKKFDGRMKWISEPDNGIYDAMNKGIRMASGEVIGILNSDDTYWDDKVIAKVVSSFIAEGSDVLFGDLVFVAENDPSKIVRTWRTGQYHAGAFRKGWHPPHPTFFVKKEIYKKYGVFDTSFDVSADFEIMLRFIEKYQLKVSYINDYLVRMRMGGNSTGSIKKILIGNKNVVRAFKKNNISVSALYMPLRIIPKFNNIIINWFRNIVYVKSR